MGKNVDKKLADILSSVDKGKLEKNSKAINQIINSNEGQKLKNQIGQIDKNKLIEAFSSMDSNDIKNKLSRADVSKLNGLTAEEIIRKLKNL